MLNIFVTSRDIEYLRKLIMGIFGSLQGYLPVYFKEYRIFGTPLYKPHFFCAFYLTKCYNLKIICIDSSEAFSKLWCAVLSHHLPKLQVFFSLTLTDFEFFHLLQG